MQKYGEMYRFGVGICLFNEDGKVFVGERLDTPNAWQMPQGGADSNEFVDQAALRELQEETGIISVKILEIAQDPIFYDLPPELSTKLWNGKYRGQEQIWIAMRFTGHEDEINLQSHSQHEFANWKWADLQDTLELIVPFKKDVYEKVIAMFGKYSS